MGKLEERTTKRIRRNRLQKIILGSVALAGIISVGLVATNVIGAMDKLGLLPRPRQREYVSSSAAKLVKRDLLRFKDGYYQLTEKGERLLRRLELSDYRLNKPGRWDGKWRMVIFDIQEKKRKIRVQIRRILGQTGFYRLQDSVWVYPYDCEDIIGLLKTDLGVGKEILYIIANEIENDKHLRSEFGLL